MSKKLGNLLLLLGLALFVFAPTASLLAAPTTQPQEVIKSTIDSVVKIVEELPGDTNLKSRRGKIKTLLEPRFDFAEMAKRSLGANWSTISTEQQKQFVDAFSKLLSDTYVARIENVKRDMVKVKNESVDGDKAIVKTSVLNKGDTFPIDYRLMDKGGAWLVYDVVIENIGLVANYRNEFAGIMRREKFDGLMAKISAKTKDS